MRRLTTAVVLLAASSLAWAGLSFTPGGLGGGLEWDAIAEGYQYLVIMGSPDAYDPEDPTWGVEFERIFPDSVTGAFPTSCIIRPSFMVLTGRCIADQICIRQCPVNAIDLDPAGRAVIDPDLCISCGLCAPVCPTNAIFAPSASTTWVLFGADADDGLTVVQEMTE
jgi:ferredoxin